MLLRPSLHAALALFLAAAGFATAQNSTGLLLVTNKADQTMSIVDPIANKQIATLPEDGKTGHELAASPDGRRAFIPIYGDSGVGKAGSDGRHVQVVDIKERKTVGLVDLGKGMRPHHAVFNPKNGLLYITTELENSVTIIDPASLKVVGSIPTGKPESHMLAITRDGRRGYTSNVESGTVSVLDLEEKKLITTIPVAKKAQRIALSIDDRWAFTADQTQAQLAVIDTKTNEVAHRIDLPDFGFGTAATPDGKSLLVCVGLHEVALVDLASKKVVRTLQVPRAPQQILIRPDGAVAYVSCDASAKVAVIDLQKFEVSALIDAGKNADGLAWAKGE